MRNSHLKRVIKQLLKILVRISSFSGHRASYHENGQWWSKGNYKDGKEDGLWESVCCEKQSDGEQVPDTVVSLSIPIRQFGIRSIGDFSG